jgi:hypothetical protein
MDHLYMLRKVSTKPTMKWPRSFRLSETARHCAFRSLYEHRPGGLPKSPADFRRADFRGSCSLRFESRGVLVPTRRGNDQFERSVPALSYPDGNEIGIGREESIHSKALGQRSDARVYDPKMESFEFAVDRRGSGEVAQSWRLMGMCAACHVPEQPIRRDAMTAIAFQVPILNFPRRACAGTDREPSRRSLGRPSRCMRCGCR